MYGNLYSTDRRRREIEKAQAKITEVRDNLAGMMLDMLDEAEDYAIEHNLPFDDFVEVDGRESGIMYPENVAPDLDNAITSLDEAWKSLHDMLPKPKVGGSDIVD